jgi:hypothetical protein
MRTTGNPCREDAGQSMVETVIVLPVILLLFLGLYYFKDLVDTRIRAVQAARYLTWEAVWNARENRPNRAIKDDATFKKELEKMGLGRGLVAVQGLKARRSMKDYSDATNGANGFADVPQFIGAFFQNPERKSTSSSNAPGTNQVPNESSVSGVIGDLLKVAGGLTFGLSDIIAKMTLWQTEADGAVFTSFVTYRVKGTSVFKFLGNVDISQTGSILAHPYNVVRGTNQSEYDRVFGTGKIGDCFSGAGKGHIFDLWFAPSVPIPGLQEVASFGKCALSTLGSALGITKFLGGSLEFKTPDGTVKEYPEKNL